PPATGRPRRRRHAGKLHRGVAAARCGLRALQQRAATLVGAARETGNGHRGRDPRGSDGARAARCGHRARGVHRHDQGPRAWVCVRAVMKLAIVTIAGVLVGGCRLLTRNPAGFQERAREAGIAFRMHFLPKEQGEPFHINLYDHGAGLAVGDYDNDGREDIYFLDQRGSNALYRNMGNGTFVDVTAATGASTGKNISVGATFADYDNDGWPDLFITTTRGGTLL